METKIRSTVQSVNSYDSSHPVLTITVIQCVINMKSNVSRPGGKLSVNDTLIKLMNVSDGSIRKVNTDGLDCKPLLKPHF